MKVLVGSFTTESNSKTPYKTTIADYDIAFGRKLIDVMEIESAYQSEDVEIIPGVYANANAASVIEKDTFLYIESLLLKIDLKGRFFFFAQRLFPSKMMAQCSG